MTIAARLRDLVRLDGSATDLLTYTVEALPRWPSELFSVANRYRFSEGRLTPGELVARGTRDFSKLQAAFATIEDTPPEFLGVDSSLTSTTKADSWNESAEQAARISECADFVGTVIQVGEGRFAMAGAGVAERMVRPRYELRSYAAIKLLLANNFRVRDALGEGSALELGDAVLEASGTVVEARSDGLQARHARSALGELVRARERLDGFDALDHADALVRWNELAKGRYILLDHIDTDQRRYIVCFRMDAQQTSPFALSQVEQRVLERMLVGARNKTIAGELNVSSPHVSGIAQRALSKLGASALSDLTRVLHARKLVLGELSLASEALVALGYEESTAELLHKLTATERVVARALLDGLSHREIALERGVSARTVASQVASIYRKLAVSGRRELTAKVTELSRCG